MRPITNRGLLGDQSLRRHQRGRWGVIAVRKPQFHRQLVIFGGSSSVLHAKQMLPPHQNNTFSTIISIEKRVGLAVDPPSSASRYLFMILSYPFLCSSFFPCNFFINAGVRLVFCSAVSGTRSCFFSSLAGEAAGVTAGGCRLIPDSSFVAASRPAGWSRSNNDRRTVIFASR